MEANVEQHRALAIRGIPLTGILSEQQAREVLQTVYRGAPDVAITKAAIICRDFGLHPLMKHLYLISFKNKDGTITWEPVLGIGATRLMMSRQGSFSYMDDTPRIMSEEEQKRIFGKVDPANIVAITKLRTKDGLQASGYGKYPRNMAPYGSDKGNSGENMAFIRSERNAFSRLFPDAKMPANVEVVDETYMPAISVNRETGEVLDEPEGIQPPAESITPPKAPEAPSRSAQPGALDATAFWTEVKRNGWTQQEVEHYLQATVPIYLKRHPEKTYQDILDMLGVKEEAKP